MIELITTHLLSGVELIPFYMIKIPYAYMVYLFKKLKIYIFSLIRKKSKHPTTPNANILACYLNHSLHTLDTSCIHSALIR